jgi:hypothetical protein
MWYGREPNTLSAKVSYWLAWIVGVIGFTWLSWFFLWGKRP